MMNSCKRLWQLPIILWQGVVDMANVADIIKLLQRSDKIYRARPREASDLGEIAVEWLKILGGCDAAMLNEALTVYIKGDGGAYAHAPKPGELMGVYNELLRERQGRRDFEQPTLCSLCGDQKRVIVQAKPEDLFWGNYSVLAIVCPCRRAGEMKALKQGLRVTRQISKRKPNGDLAYLGKLELWLEEGALFGKLEPVGAPKAAEKPVVTAKSISVQNAFSSIQVDLPF